VGALHLCRVPAAGTATAAHARKDDASMSQDARRAKRAGKVVLQLYKEHAPRVAEIADRMGVTCKEGCSHCCMIPATATIPEMVPVVEYLVSRCDWDRRRPALERELTRQLTEFAGVNVLDPIERTRFFTRQLPCAFLAKDKRCEIYAVRPAVCRYHMVVSPPENCALGALPNSVERLDLKKNENTVAIHAAQAFGELTGGPIALAFVLAAKLLGVKLNVDHALMKRVTMVRIEVKA
jgi:Fe-S-cluster containining protein